MRADILARVNATNKPFKYSLSPIGIVAAFEKSTTRYIKVFKDETFIGYLMNDLTTTLEPIVCSSTKMSKSGYYSRHRDVIERELDQILATYIATLS